MKTIRRTIWVIVTLIVLTLLFLGVGLPRIESEVDNQLLGDIGNGIALAFICMLLSITVGHNKSKTKYSKPPLRVLHIAWIISLSISVFMLCISSTFYPNGVWAAVSAFVTTWVTYWGCRWIIQGFNRQEETDEHERTLGLG